MIPETKTFEDILQKISLELLSPNQIKYTICNSNAASDRTQVISRPEISIFYESTNEVSFESLLKKICVELKYRGHKNDEKSATLILGFVCLSSKSTDSRLSVLNRIIGNICSADLSQFYFFPQALNQIDMSYDFGSFAIGNVDKQKIKYRTEKAESDYFSRADSELSNRISIERQVIKAKAFDANSLLDDIKSYNSIQINNLWNRFIDCYFEHLSSEYFHDFFKAWELEQEIFVVLGAPYQAGKVIRSLPGSIYLSVFLKMNGRGFVIPMTTMNTPTLNFAGIDKKLEPLKDIERRYELNGQSTFAGSIKTFCRFMFKAISLEADGYRDEAFLHYVIALDLLFGEKNNINQTVTRRIAATLSRTFEDYKNFLSLSNRIYDSRSRYAHKGEAIPGDLHSLMPNYCISILASLIRLHSSEIEGSDLCWEDWIKNLDFCSSSHMASQKIDEGIFNKNAIGFHTLETLRS